MIAPLVLALLTSQATAATPASPDLTARAPASYVVRLDEAVTLRSKAVAWNAVALGTAAAAAAIAGYQAFEYFNAGQPASLARPVIVTLAIGIVLSAGEAAAGNSYSKRADKAFAELSP